MKKITGIGIFLVDDVYRINPKTMTDRYAPSSERFAIFLDKNVSVKELGQKALEVLRKPRVILPHPKNPSDSTKEWLKAMRFKSWKYVVQKGKTISLDFAEDKIRLLSWKPDGSRLGPSGKLDRFCPDNDPEALGQAIIDTFADCED